MKHFQFEMSDRRPAFSVMHGRLRQEPVTINWLPVSSVFTYVCLIYFICVGCLRVFVNKLIFLCICVVVYIRVFDVFYTFAAPACVYIFGFLMYLTFVLHLYECIFVY